MYRDMFVAADKAGRGRVNPQESQLSRSGFDRDALIEVWKLADVTSTGELDFFHYAIACHVITRKMNLKIEFPLTTPPELLAAAASLSVPDLGPSTVSPPPPVQPQRPPPTNPDPFAMCGLAAASLATTMVGATDTTFATPAASAPPPAVAPHAPPPPAAPPPNMPASTAFSDPFAVNSFAPAVPPPTEPSPGMPSMGGFSDPFAVNSFAPAAPSPVSAPAAPSAVAERGGPSLSPARDRYEQAYRALGGGPGGLQFSALSDAIRRGWQSAVGSDLSPSKPPPPLTVGQFGKLCGIVEALLVEGVAPASHPSFGGAAEFPTVEAAPHGGGRSRGRSRQSSSASSESSVGGAAPDVPASAATGGGVAGLLPLIITPDERTQYLSLYKNIGGGLPVSKAAVRRLTPPLLPHLIRCT